MITDTWTVMWKEWKELLTLQTGLRGGKYGFLFLILIRFYGFDFLGQSLPGILELFEGLRKPPTGFGPGYFLDL